MTRRARMRMALALAAFAFLSVGNARASDDSQRADSNGRTETAAMVYEKLKLSEQEMTELTLGSDGKMYGGARSLTGGEIFRLAPDGTATTLNTFSGDRYSTKLSAGNDGFLYGATNGG